MSIWSIVFLVVALVAFVSPLLNLVIQLRRATPRQPRGQQVGLTYSVAEPDGTVVVKNLESDDADSIVAWLDSIQAGTIVGADEGDSMKKSSNRIANDLTGWIVGGSVAIIVAFSAVA